MRTAASVAGVPATALLTDAALLVEPGSPVETQISVANNGDIVDELVVEVLGPAAAWAEVLPRSVNLMPEATAVVQVRFQPPRGPAAPAGQVPYGIRVASRQDPAGSVVEEGTLTIAPFVDVRAELLPARRRGPFGARFQLVLDNWGNVPIELDLQANDDGEELACRVIPSRISPPPGDATFTRLQVRPRRRFLRGQPRTHRVQVSARSQGIGPVVAQATYVQEPMVGAWIPKLALAVLAGALALAVLWFAVINRAVKSTARSEAQEVVADGLGVPPEEAAAAIGDVQAQAGEAETTAEGASDAAAAAQEDAAAASAQSAVATEQVATLQSKVEELTKRLDLATIAGTPAHVVLTPANPTSGPWQPAPAAGSPPWAQFSVTDVVLQNLGNETTGLLVVSVVGEPNPIITINLGNFRDLDYHFIAPIRFSADRPVQMSGCVSCNVLVAGYGR